MTRKEQIELLFQESVEEFEIITGLFKKSIELQKLEPKVLVKIKHFLENLRTILDYLGKEVFEKYCNPSKRKGYFPILSKGVKDTDIENGINGAFPFLREKYPEVFQFFRDLQPQKNINNAWLEDLNNLCNENKHESLSLQIRKDSIINILAFKNGPKYIWTDGLVEFDSEAKGVMIKPAGQYSVTIDPSKSDENDDLFKFGWIVKRIEDHKIHSLPNLSKFSKDLYTLESFALGSYYFPESKINAYFQLQNFLNRVWETSENLSKLMERIGSLNA